MTGNKYQILAARTIDDELNSTQKEMHALLGMAGELGEIHSIYQKWLQGHEFAEDSLKEELGDLLWFIAELCTVWGFKLNDVMQMNIDKLLKRYPESFDSKRSVNREEGDN